MSRIDELIQQLCPDGVETTKLSSICEIYDGTHQTPKYTEHGVRFVSVENIGDLYRSQKFISIEDFDKNYKVKPRKNDVFMTRIGTIGSCAVINSDEPLAYYVTLTLIRPNLNKILSKFLKYSLEGVNGQRELWKHTLINATPIKINLGDIGKVSLHLPPLPVQEEIVRILDKFTALEAELEAELEARRKQYEFYRDQLLTFGDEVEWKPLGEVCGDIENIRWTEVKNKVFCYIDLSSVDRDFHKITTVSEITNETAPSRAQQIVQINDILLGTTRPLLKRFCIIPEKYNGQICSTGYCVLRPIQTVVLPLWIYYQISLQRFYDYIEKYQKGASYPAISDSDVKRYKIPVPPLAEQERIVAILDKFDALINDISSGLPAELEMRRKQYEHYRDRLLTFKPLAKEA